MLHSIRTLFVLLFVFSFSLTLFGQKPATKYFSYSVGSSWVYEDQDGNKLKRLAVEGEEIDGKLYHAFSYEPKLADQTAYSPFIYPRLYHVTGGGSLVLLAGDEIEKSIKAQLTKEIEVLTSDPEAEPVPPAADTLAIKVRGQDLLFFLPDNLDVDTPWEVNKIEVSMKLGGNDFDEEAVFSFTITETGHVLGTETIQIPAGTFEDCLKVEYRTQTKVSITTEAPPPDEIEPPGETITTVWFAPGIGIVKYHQKSDNIFLSMIPADEIELDIAEILPSIERTFQLKAVDIK